MSMNTYPYVYRIDHPSGEFYIGYRAGNRVPAEEDLGHKYKTSTKYLNHPFEEYSITIVAEFYLPTAKDDAYDFEQALIFEHWGDPLLANKACQHGKPRFSRAGQPVSDETRAKMSIVRRGKKHSDEHRAKIAAAAQGRTFSAESRAKMSASQRRKKHTDESRAKMSVAHLGKTHSAETKAKMSAEWHQRRAAE